MKKTANKIEGTCFDALQELEIQRVNYIAFLPYCYTHSDQKKLLKEVLEITEEINIFLKIIIYEQS